MPIAFELDTPGPDETVGWTFRVEGTYDLGVVPENTKTSAKVVCVLRNAAGNQATDSHGGLVPPKSMTLPTNVSYGTWYVDFTVDMNYTNHQVTAHLEFGPIPYPSDGVEGIDIELFAGGDIGIIP